MKTVLTTLLVMFLMVSGFTQENPSSKQHMTFKGIPIDGTLNEFTSKLKSDGFDHVGTEDGSAILLGDFAGYKQCLIGAVTLQQKDLVSQVTVIFPENETWSDLSSNYFYLKELLTEKYGEPEKVVEKFEGYSEPREDESKMHQIRFDNCKYITDYQTTDGYIELKIDHESVSSCFVRLTYVDKINSSIIREKAKGDL